MKQTINEQQLRNVIANMVMEEIEMQQINEGSGRDKWNQLKAGVSTFAQRNAGKTLSDRWQDTKENWSNQGDINNFRNLKKDVVEYMNFINKNGGKTKLSYQSTIGELVGSLEIMTGTRSRSIGRNGGNAYDTKTQGFRG
jgi:hypothetical protein